MWDWEGQRKGKGFFKGFKFGKFVERCKQGVEIIVTSCDSMMVERDYF